MTGTRPLRVVVCDDSRAMREAIRQVLALAEAVEVVAEARDGIEAVEQAGRLRPDVMLLDLSMPERDGLEALPLVRAASPGTRIVVLSGFDEQVAGERALELGAACYLQKGAEPEEIIAAVEGAAG